MADLTDSMQEENNNLKKEIERLKKSVKEKKYGLVWMDSPEKFDEECENKLPILRESEKAVINDDGKPTHILIEGDNYHALTCLNYTHKGKIDVVYIDPPYNTGAKDWKYNNKYVEENDPWRHSKWICFMANRLHLAKRLLKKDGVLICAIDENEHAALGLLLEYIFPTYKIDCITIVHNPRGVQGKNFSYCHEYAYFIYPDDGERYIGNISRPDPSLRNLRDNGGGSLRENAKNCFYPFIVKNLEIIDVGEVLPEKDHPKSQTVMLKDGYQVWPIDGNGVERKWRYSVNTVKEIFANLRVKEDERGLQILLYKDEDRYKTVWVDKKYDSNEYGAKLLRKIIGSREFPYPKSLYNIHDCLLATCSDNKNAIVLDYFAGSGTTAHAVMEMNKADGGNRQFIMCTNNENKICEQITYPRIEKVINGYPFKGKEKELLYEQKITVTNFRKSSDVLAEIDFIKLQNEKKYEKFEMKIEDDHIRFFGIRNIKGKTDGLGGSLKYYKTTFIGKNNIMKATDEDKIELAHQAGDLLALAENTLYKVKENKFWQIYKNGERFTAVYFREELDKFDEFVEMVEKLKCPTTVYVFSWGDEEFAEEFEHIEWVKVKTIPLPILEIYKNIYNLG